MTFTTLELCTDLLPNQFTVATMVVVCVRACVLCGNETWIVFRATSINEKIDFIQLNMILYVALELLTLQFVGHNLEMPKSLSLPEKHTREYDQPSYGLCINSWQTFHLIWSESDWNILQPVTMHIYFLCIGWEIDVSTLKKSFYELFSGIANSQHCSLCQVVTIYENIIEPKKIMALLKMARFSILSISFNFDQKLFEHFPSLCISPFVLWTNFFLCEFDEFQEPK